MSKNAVVIFFSVLGLLAAGAGFYFSRSSPKPKNQIVNNTTQKINSYQSKNMNITSSAFQNNESIPSKYTCDGESINPPLEISGVPEEAKSLALILHDPDAPVAGGFTHWIVLNIDPKTSAILENSLPENATQGQNSAEQSKYTGPCPPSGTHRYFFKLYALDATLNHDSFAKREDVERSMSDHILDQTELIGLYKRN